MLNNRISISEISNLFNCDETIINKSIKNIEEKINNPQKRNRIKKLFCILDLCKCRSLIKKLKIPLTIGSFVIVFVFSTILSILLFSIFAEFQFIRLKVNLLQYFWGKEIYVRRGIFLFSQLFNLPIYNVLVETDINENVIINVTNLIDNPKYYKDHKSSIENFLYKELEIYLKKNGFYKWGGWTYIHSWYERLKPVEQKRLLAKSNIDINRFTKYELDQKFYVFDSKYYLSYLLTKKEYISCDIREIVSSKKVVL
jgi:hypothetical protein